MTALTVGLAVLGVAVVGLALTKAGRE